MKSRSLKLRRMLLGTASILCVTVALCGEPAGNTAPQKPGGKSAAPQIDAKDRVAVEVARDRAKLMHDIYAATLEVMHHRYFRGERTTVPARALEEVFSEIKLQSKAEARWISVNMPAMSIDHEPSNDFEKKAALEIAAGKPEVEVVADGYYRRASPIPLTGGCVSCHGGFFREPSKTPKFAGLIISVPVTTAPVTTVPSTTAPVTGDSSKSD